ncbi:MAG TPA: hypothetical protein VFH73_22345 [Polyangia bacterium]|nr:hypothetical protein [Polyangia bacterium]
MTVDVPLTRALWPLSFALVVLLAPRARAADSPRDGASGPTGPTATTVDQREIIVPAANAEMVRIDNPLGRVEVRAWNRPGQIHIVAEKRATNAEALSRLRVHYTAWQSGEVQIDTRVELFGQQRSLPLSGSGIDLLVEVPPELAIAAKTFGGDLSASGLRAGARLETTGGRIGISDVRGGVVTRQLQGGQTVTSVEGDVDLDGVEGNMDLRSLGGGRLDARVVDGRIRAEDIRSAVVRLTTTTGEIVFIGLLRPAAHYDLRSYAGDIHLVPAAASARFALRARSGMPVESGLPLRTVSRDGERLQAVYSSKRGAGASPGALVELTSVLGRVVIQPREAAARPTD